MSLSVQIPVYAAAKVSNGATCKKLGAVITASGKVFECAREAGKLRWRPQSSKERPVETPSPTSQIASLPVTPIVSLGESGKDGVPIRATIYLESFSFVTTLKYFLVVNASRGLSPSCSSGGKSTGLSTMYRSGFSGRPNLEGRTNSFPIPTFPITMECDLAEAPEYKFFVVQAVSANSLESAMSSVTSISLANYVNPSPKPSPSLSTSSQVTIRSGQACAPEGFSVKASDGQTYFCKKSVTDSILRWVKQA